MVRGFDPGSCFKIPENADTGPRFNRATAAFSIIAASRITLLYWPGDRSGFGMKHESFRCADIITNSEKPCPD